MRTLRWIEYQGGWWNLSQLAKSGNLPVGTFAARLERFGCDEAGITRALATGVISRQQAGIRGKEHSPWTHQLYHREKENGAE